MRESVEEPQNLKIASALLVFILYVGLFELSGGAASNEFFGPSWPIFLPAFTRLFGVLTAGLWAIPALFAAGYMCVDFGLDPGGRAMIALCLATGAPIAILVTSHALNLKPTLENLTPGRLLILSIASGLGNSIFYNLGLFLTGVPRNDELAHLTTFAGDVIGTWIIIYLIKLGIHFWCWQRKL